MENNEKVLAQYWLERYANQLGVGAFEPAYATFEMGQILFTSGDYTFTPIDKARLKITKWTHWTKGFSTYAFVEVTPINSQKHISEHLAKIEAISKLPPIITVMQTFIEGKEYGEWTVEQQRETLAYYNIIHTAVDITGTLIRRVFTLQLKGE